MFGRTRVVSEKHQHLDPMRFEKIIYNYKTKSQEIIYKALELEVEYIRKINPGYELKEFSKPIKNNDGSLTYYITFKK